MTPARHPFPSDPGFRRVIVLYAATVLALVAVIGFAVWLFAR